MHAVRFHYSFPEAVHAGGSLCTLDLPLDVADPSAVAGLAGSSVVICRATVGRASGGSFYPSDLPAVVAHLPGGLALGGELNADAEA